MVALDVVDTDDEKNNKPQVFKVTAFEPLSPWTLVHRSKNLFDETLDGLFIDLRIK